MRNSAAARVLEFGAAIALCCLFCSPVAPAQTAATGKTEKSAKAQPAGQVPDLSGVWAISPRDRSWDPADPEGKNPDALPMTPLGKEKLKAAKPPFGADQTFDNINDPVQKYCDPPGLSRLYTSPWQFSIVQSSARVDILFEYFHLWRTVGLNRQHPQDPDPTWLGDSVGKYEGDTLVIDTIGFNGRTWLDQLGHPLSEAAHIIERVRRVDHSTLQIDLTVDDPQSYTKTFTATRTYKLSSLPLGETMCSVSDMQSFQKSIIDQTLPPTPAK
jgi:hypothetical protein